MSEVPDEPVESHEGLDDPATTDTGIRALIDRGRERVASEQARLNRLIEEHQDDPILSFGLRVYQRDRQSAGNIVGSALAFRLFLFFLPLMLFSVGLLGFFGGWLEAKEVSDTVGVSGSIAAQINTALSQPTSTRWIATVAGFVGMVWAGRALSKVMVSASCLAWQLPVTTKASVRVIGSVVGLVGAMVVVASAVNRIRRDVGVAVAGLSFLAVLAIYAVAWMAMSLQLPRRTRDPGAVLPGAVVVGSVLAGMQAISQLYLAGQIGRASALYGALAVTTVSLGWFFFLGRAMVFGMSLDAVVYERFGSISTFVFGLPLVRILPRRSAWIRRFFDLER
jgi:uncharacterized BrkB/YihY/UPF0761 family membrane protein